MIRFAEVTAVHPESRTVDIVFADTGMPVGRVQVLSSAAGSDFGEWDMPDVQKPSGQAAAGGLAQGGRRVMVAVMFSGRRPMVMGFVQPQGGQAAVKEANRSVKVHPSGAYVTTAPDGSWEAFHPSGAYLRIGTGAHEDLAAKAANGWATPSGAPPATITLATSGFTLTIAPGGNVTLTSAGNASIVASGTLSVQSGGDMTLTAGGALHLHGATIDLN